MDIDPNIKIRAVRVTSAKESADIKIQGQPLNMVTDGLILLVDGEDDPDMWVNDIASKGFSIIAQKTSTVGKLFGQLQNAAPVPEPLPKPTPEPEKPKEEARLSTTYQIINVLKLVKGEHAIDNYERKALQAIINRLEKADSTTL